MAEPASPFVGSMQPNDATRLERLTAALWLVGLGGRAALGHPLGWGDRVRLGLGGWLLLGVTGLIAVVLAVWVLWYVARVGLVALAVVLTLALLIGDGVGQVRAHRAAV